MLRFMTFSGNIKSFDTQSEFTEICLGSKSTFSKLLCIYGIPSSFVRVGTHSSKRKS